MSHFTTRASAAIVPSTGNLVLNTELLASLSPVLSALGVSELSLSSPQITDEPHGARVIGSASLLGRSDVAVTLSVDDPDSEASPSEISVAFSNDVQFDALFSSLPESKVPMSPGSSMLVPGPSILSGLVFGSASWIARSQPSHAPAGAVELVAMLKDDSPLAAIDPSLESGASRPVRGWLAIDPSSSGAPNLKDFSIDLMRGPSEITVGPIHVSELSLAIERRPRGAAEANTTLVARGEAEIGGETAELEAIHWPNLPEWRFSLEDPTNHLTIDRGISALSHWIGGEGTDLSLPAPLDTLGSIALQSVAISVDTKRATVNQLAAGFETDQSWDLISDLMSVSDLKLLVGAQYPFTSDFRQLFGTIRGTLALGSQPPVLFDVGADYDDDFSVFGSLADGQSIHLAALAEAAVGSSIHVPTLDVSQLSLHADQSGRFHFNGAIDSGWSIPIGPTQFKLETVAFDLSHEPGAGGQTATNAFSVRGNFEVGGVQLTVSANHDAGGSGWRFSGRELAGNSISLSALADDLLKRFDITLPAPLPKVELSNLQIDVDTGTHTVRVAGESLDAGILPIASSQHPVHTQVDLTIATDPETGKHTFSGFVEADVTFGSAVFQVRYEMGKGQHQLDASWTEVDGQSLSLDDVAHALGISHSIDLPSEFDLSLVSAIFEYDPGAERFVLAAESKNHGEAFLVAQKGSGDPTVGSSGAGEGEDATEGDWNVVFGLDVEAAGTDATSDVGRLASRVESAIHLDQVTVLFSSEAHEVFRVPTLPSLPSKQGDPQSAPAAASTGGESSTPAPAPAVAAPSTDGQDARPASRPAPRFLGGQPLKLAKDSVSFAFALDLRQSPERAAVNLGSMIPGGELVFQAEISPTEVDVSASLDGALSIKTGAQSDLRLSQPSVGLDFTETAVTAPASGQLRIHIDHKTIIATAALRIDEEEAEVTFNAQATEGELLTLPGFEGVHVDEFGFEMGVVFEPPGVNLGIEGQFHIADAEPGTDSFALVLEMVEEIPNPQALQFSIDEMSLATAIAAVTNKPPANLPAPLEAVRATEVSFRWAEEPVILPDGTTAQPGVAFQGFLDVLGFEAFAQISVDSTGFTGTAEMDPVEIGPILSIHGKGKGISITEVQAEDGNWVRPRANESLAGRTTRQQPMVSPGGAVVHVSSQASPYLQASWNVSLFSILSEEVDVEITDTGATFHLAYDISHLFHATLDCTINKDQGFDATAQLRLGLDEHIGPIDILGVDLGTIHLETMLEATMELSVSKTKFHAAIEGTFDFEGVDLELPRLQFDVPFDHFDQLPGLIVEQIEKNAKTIFVTLVEDAGRLLEAGAKEVAHLAAEGLHEVEKIGAEAAHEVGVIAHDAEKFVTHSVEEAAHAAEALANNVEHVIEDGAQAVAHVAEAAAHEVEVVAQEAEQVVEEAVHEVEKIAQAVAHDVQVVEHEIVVVGKAIVHEVAAIAAAAEKWVAHTLQAAAAEAKKILDAAAKVVAGIAHAAKAVWNEVSHFASKVGHAISSGLHKAAHWLSSLF